MAADWRRALLRAIGAPVTSQNVRFLTNWQRWEGGATNNSASYNWLNTTHGPGQSINSVGVKAFGDFGTGIKSLAETLMNGRYDDIMAGLHAGNPFAHDVSGGLETWVSGSPTGNPGYARKVLGGAAGKAVGAVGHMPMSTPGLPAPPSGLDPELIRAVFGGGQLGGLAQSVLGGGTKMPSLPSLGMPSLPKGPTVKGPGISIPVHWAGTHVTDGLGWGTDTARDFMGSPGTPVSLSQDVTVVYYHPTGAQGGGSMLLRTPSGREYWVGHITSHARPGQHFRAGQAFAYIADQHVSAPHVHVDARNAP